MSDKRFAKFSSDPKFRSVPKKNRQVKIDSRFSGLFKDKRFNNKVSVDKRGKPKNFSSSENYKKYYKIEQDDSDEDEDKDEEQDEEEPKGDSTIWKKLKDRDVDYARGEGILGSDSSSEEESEEDPDEQDKESADEDEQFSKWGELDHDAERTTTDDSITARLALCNMDWDRVGAKDIYVALNSFCPSGGNVKKVAVYKSEFGKERLREEDQLGPRELRNRSKNDRDSSDEEDEEDQEVIEKKAMERVRQYQINRLKYYYAVVSFDSKESANAVYSECDGMEFELSASRFDLRFIPEDTEFDETPTDICDSSPQNYKPKEFVSMALQLGKVELTWDETDPERTKAMQRAFENVDDDNADDFKAYLASDNDDEDDKFEFGSGSEDDDENMDAVEKYKALLLGIKDNDDNNEEEGEGDMEVTWKEEAPKKINEKPSEDLTPWEQYLEKKKQKRKDKKSRNMKKHEEEEGETNEESAQAFSDDEIPDGFDDPFFKENSTTITNKKDKKNKNKKSGKVKKNNDDEISEENKDLALLTMDSDDDKKHFDYKDIVKNESKKKKKKKRKAEEMDDFELDVRDSRFGAIYEDADYNIDPSHPNFKKTKSMQSLINEKQKRIRSKKDDATSTKKKSSTDLEKLVKSVKMKTKQTQQKRTKNKFKK